MATCGRPPDFATLISGLQTCKRLDEPAAGRRANAALFRSRCAATMFRDNNPACARFMLGRRFTLRRSTFSRVLIVAFTAAAIMLAPAGTGARAETAVAPFDGGLKAFVSHWDAGEVLLDLTDPASPVYLGRTTYPRGARGNAHSAALARGAVLVDALRVGSAAGALNATRRGLGSGSQEEIERLAARVDLEEERTCAH